MPRLLILGLAASALLVSAKATAQLGVPTAVANSDAFIESFEFKEAREIIIKELGNNPSDGEREALMGQLDKISDAIPYYMHLDLSSAYTTGTRQGLWSERLNWSGVPHYTDETLAVEAAEEGLITSVGMDIGYGFELSPDASLSIGADGELNFYEETDFMEAWIGEVYTELDLSIGPILSNTRLSYVLSSKSREKVDLYPNVPRVPGMYSYNAAQDLGITLAKDQVFGLAFTYRLGDETQNVQFPGTAYEHATLETYYDAKWADILNTRLFGYGQAAVADPEHTGFFAYGGGASVGADLPAGFEVDGALEYRTQAGYAPFPERTTDLDVSTVSGSLEIRNAHFALGGLAPYLNASFWDSTATYDEYDRSDLAFGAGIRLGF